MHWVSASVAGFALALSSTAFSLQSLIEKGELKTPYGQAIFSVLLMQDILAIPALAIIPLLGSVKSGVETSTLPSLGVVVLFITLLIISSRTWVGALFRWIAQSGSREIFTALTLFLVLGVSFAMHGQPGKRSKNGFEFGFRGRVCLCDFICDIENFALNS